MLNGDEGMHESGVQKNYIYTANITQQHFSLKHCSLVLTCNLVLNLTVTSKKKKSQTNIS